MLGQDLRQIGSFKSLDRCILGCLKSTSLCSSWLLCNRQIDVFKFQACGIRQNDGALKHTLQLAHVARPMIGEECLHGLAETCDLSSPVLMSIEREKMLRQ